MTDQSTGYVPPAGWTQPDKRGHIQFTLAQPPTMHDQPPKREGYEPFFVAMCDRYTRWTYRPLPQPQPMLQLRLTGYGPDDGIVMGPFHNVELMPGTGYVGVQHAGEEEWTEYVIEGYDHVFVEVAGTEPGGVA